MEHHEAKLVHPRYRPDIDGLRAVAVLSVLVFHAFPEWLPGGFIGVDIFFVISGYLISTIILRSMDGSGFSFVEFYIRRARRIFPSLLAVLFACLIAGWLLLLADDFRLLGRHVVGGAVFVSNFVLWQESGYFDQAAALKPLLHLWSLGIEEQFYLIWPVTLWLAWRRSIRARVPITLILCVSLIWSLWSTPIDSTAAFYSPLTRFWELLIGALLAEVHLSGNFANWASGADGARKSKLLANGMSLLGAGLIAASAGLLDAGDPFPGWRALPPTLGACLIIASGSGAILNKRLLSLRPVIWIGLISYPLYLWHWPLLSFQNIQSSGVIAPVERFAALIASIALAAATYYWIEKPIRFGPHPRRHALQLGLGLATAAVAGLIIVRQDGFESRFPGPVARYSNFQYPYGKDARLGSCWLSKQDGPKAYGRECIDAPDERPLLVVWGDSHAARLFPGVRAVAGNKFRLAQFTRNSCPPIFHPPGLVARGPLNCIRGNSYVMSRIRELKPHTAVLFADWSKEWSTKALRERLLPTIAELKSAGVLKVIVIGPGPVWQKSLPQDLVRLYQQTQAPTPRRTKFALLPDAPIVDARMQEVIGNGSGAQYFSAWSALCDERGCLTRIGNDPDALTSWDYGHFTTPAAIFVIRKLAATSGDFGLE